METGKYFRVEQSPSGEWIYNIITNFNWSVSHLLKTAERLTGANNPKNVQAMKQMPQTTYRTFLNINIWPKIVNEFRNIIKYVK